MAVILSTWLDERLWTILENGRDTPRLVRVGNRRSFRDSAGWMKEVMAKAPADFPHLAIEVGVSGSHSAYTQDATFASEDPEMVFDQSIDFSVGRTERVRATLRTDKPHIRDINELREAVIDDWMRSGPCLGQTSSVSGFGPFTFDQRMWRRGDRGQSSGWLCTLNFPVNFQQRGRATVRGQE